MQAAEKLLANWSSHAELSLMGPQQPLSLIALYFRLLWEIWDLNETIHASFSKWRHKKHIVHTFSIISDINILQRTGGHLIWYSNTLHLPYKANNSEHSGQIYICHWIIVFSLDLNMNNWQAGKLASATYFSIQSQASSDGHQLK